MAKTFQPRRKVAEPDTILGARPGVGVLGIARGEAAADQSASSDRSEGTLTVGNGIFVKGEIESCHTLVVDGRVEASLEAEDLKVRKDGVYKGSAAVEVASIAGEFEGDLTVRGLLTIEAGGKASGTIRYSEIVIKAGGRIRGDVGLIPAIVADEDVA